MCFCICWVWRVEITCKNWCVYIYIYSESLVRGLRVTWSPPSREHFHFEPSGRPLGIDMDFRVPSGGSKMTHIAQQGINWHQVVPWSDPKTTQMHMGEPFKTCGICGVGATLSHLRRDRKSILRHFVFLAPTFLGSWWFFPNLGSTWCSKWTPRSCPNESFSDQGVHSGVQEGLGCRNYFQILTGLQCIHVIKIGGS